MIEPEAGNRYGGTDWTSWDVVQIWQAIENQDTAASYELLTGWQRSYELVSQHLTQVRNYRENLAAAWPPAKSPAAAAYIERLDTLIAHLTGTYNAAVTNYQVLSAATSAITQARTGVQAIHHEYASNQAKIEEYRAAKQTFAGRYVLPKAQPPVPDGRQEELTYRARTIMFGLSNELIQARTQISNPPPYDPASYIDGGSRDAGDETKTGSGAHIAAGFHSSPHADQPSSGRTGHGDQPINATHVTRPPLLILGGVVTPDQPMQISSDPQPMPLRGTLPQIIMDSNPSSTGLMPYTKSVDGLRTFLKDGMTRGTIDVSIGRPSSHLGQTQPSAPGGVIGGTPRVGQSNQPQGKRVSSRINPIGGVIRPSTATANTLAGDSSRGITGQIARNVVRPNDGRQSGSDASERQRPDSVWVTDEGVAPIVRPVPHQEVEPGPAIGLT